MICSNYWTWKIPLKLTSKMGRNNVHWNGLKCLSLGSCDQVLVKSTKLNRGAEGKQKSHSKSPLGNWFLAYKPFETDVPLKKILFNTRWSTTIKTAIRQTEARGLWRCSQIYHCSANVEGRNPVVPIGIHMIGNFPMHIL